MRDRLRGLVEEMLESGVELPWAVNELERLFIEAAVKRTAGNRSRAAELLGIHRNTLSARLNSSQGRKHRGSRRPRRRSHRPGRKDRGRFPQGRNAIG
jgi:DNA-binding NtrC family response regulator